MLLSLSCETDAAGAIIGSGPSQALVWSDLDISEQLCPVTLLGMTIFANIKLETTALKIFCYLKNFLYRLANILDWKISINFV